LLIAAAAAVGSWFLLVLGLRNWWR